MGDVVTSGDFMGMALDLAMRGRGRVSPNPLVGAVIVNDGVVIGTGFHRVYGGAHAEREAIADAKSRGNLLRGATLFVTLEPCSHHGKTPPCTDAIIAEEFGEVVYGSVDPNPLVAGKGHQLLVDCGIVVRSYENPKRCMAINPGFFSLMLRKRPYVTLKLAQSLDGCIAARNGSSQWITGIASRTQAHALRASHDAVAVGVGTVLCDDPALTVRHVEGVNPRVVVFDTHLRTPLAAKALLSLDRKPTVIICGDHVEIERVQAFEARGILVCKTKRAAGRTALPFALQLLASLGISSLLVEGGAALCSQFLAQELADQLDVFIGLKFLGNGRRAWDLPLLDDISEAIPLRNPTLQIFGEDVYVSGRLSSFSAMLASGMALSDPQKSEEPL